MRGVRAEPARARIGTSSTRPSTPRRLLATCASARRWLIVSVAMTAAAAGCLLAWILLLASVIDSAFLDGASLPDLVPRLVWMAALLLLRSAVLWCGVLCAQLASNDVRTQLREALGAAVVASDPRRLEGDSLGAATAAMTVGVDDIGTWVTDFAPSAAMAVAVPSMVFVSVLVIDAPSTLILAFTGPMLVLLLAVIGRRTAELTRRRFDELGWLRGFYLDILAGLPTLKAFGRGADGADLIEDTSRSFGDTTMEVLRTAFQTSLVMEWAATAATALVAVEVSFRLIDGTLSYGTALAVLVLTPEFFVAFRRLAMEYHAGRSGDAAAESIEAQLEGRGEPTATRGPMAAVVRSHRAAGTGAPGGDGGGEQEQGAPAPELTFRDVCFSYPDGAGEALEGVDLRIASGETLAVVGPSGAGKSTLASVLLRFIDPSHGSVRVDDRDLIDLDPRQWRQRVAWVPQHPTVLSGTVAENVALGDPNASRDLVEAATYHAGAQEFVESLPRGFDTRLGEGGLTLSGGQRQRLAIARAFLRDAPLVVLDEFTAHLDPVTEAGVLDAAGRLLVDRTALVIAHRVATARFGRPDRRARFGEGARVGHARRAPRHRWWVGTALPPNGIGISTMTSAAPHERRSDRHRKGSADRPASSGVVTAEPDGSAEPADLRRLISLLGSQRRWVLGTALLASATLGSGIGLIATASYLLSRAALVDSTATLTVAITSVRFFAVCRAAFRYLERYVGHLSTFRVLTSVRVWVFRGIEPLAPARLADRRGGDLLSRVIADVDVLQDFSLRVAVPAIAAGVTTVVVTVVLGSLSVVLGTCVVLYLALVGLALPVATRWLGRAPAQAVAGARAELEADVVESVSALAELVAWGRQDRFAEAVRRDNDRLCALQRRLAGIRGLATGLTALVVGLAAMTLFMIAVPMVGGGEIDGVYLALVPLVAIAAFEAVQPLSIAMEQLDGARAAAGRLDELLATPPTVTAPRHRVQPPRPDPATGGLSVDLEGLTFGYPGTDPVITELTLNIPAGSNVRDRRTQWLREVDPGGAAVALLGLLRGLHLLGRGGVGRAGPAGRPGAGGHGPAARSPLRHDGPRQPPPRRSRCRRRKTPLGVGGGGRDRLRWPVARPAQTHVSARTAAVSAVESVNA